MEPRRGRGAISGSPTLPRPLLPRPLLDAIASCSAAKASIDPASNSEARFERMALRGAGVPDTAADTVPALVAGAALGAVLPESALLARGAFGALASPSPPAAERIAATRSAFLRRVTPFNPIAPAMEWSSSRSLPSSIERSILCFGLNMGSYGN